MRFTQDGNWTISTPIYIGSPDDLAKAQACPHKRWKELIRTLKEGKILIQDRCEACVATRARWREATKEELEERPA